MRRPSRALRLANLLLVVLQLSLPASATLADARLDVASSTFHTHVEHVRSGCARVHPADCALCQFLALRIVGGGRVSLAFMVEDQAAPVPTDVVLPPAPRHTRLPHQRAPPTPL
jgi:hypothetical protein